MNWIHRRLCQSSCWSKMIETEVLPWVRRNVPMEGSVLEIGPGYGVFTRHLLPAAGHLACVEVDSSLAASLTTRFGDRASIVCGDGASLPLSDGSFDAVVCFTMLHHLPSSSRQDQLFSEVARVLKPGGVFAATDGRGGRVMSLLHIFDTLTLVEPGSLPARLLRAGFGDVEVEEDRHSFRFRARRQAAATAA